MKLLCLDTETGGLDPAEDALVEVAWCEFGTDDYHSLILPHDPLLVGEFARKINGYDERRLDDPWKWATRDEIWRLRAALNGATLVGANIAFDEAFLKANHFTGWHYRKLDLEAYALPKVGYVPDKYGTGLALPGLADVTAWLNERGWNVPTPDHTALGDVRTTVAVLAAFTEIYERAANAHAIDLLG